MMESRIGGIIVKDAPQDLSGVRLITINRLFRRNALDAGAAKALRDAIATAQSNSSVRVIVITGAGDEVFCGGADLHDLHVDGFAELLTTISESSVPIISAVNGLAVGGGLGIILASDLAVMAEDARIGTPEVSRGLFAMFILYFAYRVMPEKAVHEMLLLGKMLDAKRAMEWNIVNQVVPKTELLETALKWAAQIAEYSGPAMCLGKETMNAMKYLSRQLKTNLSLVDTQEGIKAFLEKRKPVWKI